MLETVTLTSADDQFAATPSYGETITTTYEYEHHQLHHVIYADGAEEETEEEYEYDPAGNLVSMIDRSGRETTTLYDLLNRPLVTTLPDPDGADPLSAPQFTYLYDSIGRDLRSADAVDSLTGYRYDPRGWLASLSGEQGYQEAYQYNGVGQLAAFTDALSRVTTYQYDDLARLTQILLPDPDAETANQPIVFGYDKDSRLETVTDQQDRTTDYDYNRRHWLTQVQLPAAVENDPRPETNYLYDDAGNVTSMTELVTDYGTPSYRTTDYFYDDLNRLDHVSLPTVQDGTGSNAHPLWTYKYDVYGRLTNVWDPVAYTRTADADSTQYVYNDLHQLTQALLPDPNPGDSDTSRPTTDYTYTLTGQVQQVTELVDALADPQVSRTTTYQYDALDRLIRSISPDPETGGGPDQGSNPTDPNLADPDSNTPFMVYGYDVAGNLTSESDAFGHETTYHYDRLYRQTGQTRVDPADTTRRRASATTWSAISSRSPTRKATPPPGSTTAWTAPRPRPTNWATRATSSTTWWAT